MNLSMRNSPYLMCFRKLNIHDNYTVINSQNSEYAFGGKEWYNSLQDTS